MMKRILIVVILLAIPACFGQTQTAKVRTYYVAADEVDWDYSPGGVNKMMGMKFEGYSTVFTERGPHRIGTVYRKALYREYTDDTFSRVKPRPAEWEDTGILGPILQAEVGDTIHILFKNNATDVVPLMQAQMETVDMVPDNPGIWMFHCHIDDSHGCGNGHVVQGRAVT
jgi:Multicopper oxidase